ncbi:TPA: ead/Ea22-like family protein [Klebsiella oxytoca]|nr:ead/Ea22-like family protein [Klebsiella oxytoca]
MTDITKLAQRMKAAAEKATQGEWRRASTQFNGITATPFMLGRKEVIIAGASEKRDAEFIALANPANIIALVEALEKAQETIAFQQGEIKALLSSLESRTVKLPPTVSVAGIDVYEAGLVGVLLTAAGIKWEAE